MSTSKDSCGFKIKIMKRPNLEEDYIFDKHEGDFIHHETKQSYDKDIELYIDHLEKQLSLLDVSLPKETFTCTICGDEMEEGEQCGYEDMNCPNYTGK